MTPTKRRAYAALAASTALMTLAACGDDSDDTPATSSTPAFTSAPPAAPSDAAGETATEFRPGEYDATGTYTSPDGQTQSIEVEVELLSDGTITELDADGQAESGNSEQFQGKFEDGIDDLVEGRRITELDIDKVSGSSLTSGGFNDAIEQIISRARA